SLVSGGETRGYSAFMGYIEKHGATIMAMTGFKQKEHPAGSSFRLYSRARGVLFEE
ncbi:MAG: hypothetical protein GY940_46615, partial [bacterium]|nr:hypothetical protein [bacterium]